VTAADVIDRVLEAPIITSFTNIGYAARSRLDNWTDLDAYDLSGRVMVLTGATSGLGLAAAGQLARCGATVVLAGRNPDKTLRVRDELAASTGNDTLETVIADMGDLGAVRAAAAELASRHDRVDALLHNAGALSDTRQVAPDGTELTIASQVVGPFLMTTLLLDQLRRADGRVITMASGGLYSTGLRVEGLEMSEADYKGTEQYSRAKRAQVTLNEMWAESEPEIAFHALHPGWADTPGVEESLPTFRKIVGPLLRTPQQGADTMVWLTADPEPGARTGEFWLDRRVRSIHKLGSTRRTDTPEHRTQLWAWCVDKAGVDPADV